MKNVSNKISSTALKVNRIDNKPNLSTMPVNIETIDNNSSIQMSDSLNNSILSVTLLNF